MKVIIIEDEYKTAKELKDMLEIIDNEIWVLDILPSVASAVKWFNENPSPELIFSDIQLADGLSFEIFKQIATDAPVIFCTAFDEYAIRAFESNSIDYLLKPIDEQGLNRSIEKYLRFKEHLIKSGNNHVNNLNKVVAQMDLTYKQNLLVHFREEIIPVKVSDIHFIYTSEGLVHLHLLNKDFPIQYTIEQLEALLNPQQFFRANRKFIINRTAIKKIEHYFNRKLFVGTEAVSPEKIIISKEKSPLFLKWIEL